MTQATPDLAAQSATTTPGSVEVAIVRLEGKIDRLVDGLQRHGEDMKMVRERLHDHANLITALTTLNLPEKIARINEELKDHDHRLGACENDIVQRQGMATLAKAIIAILGVLGIGGLAAIIKVLVT